MLVPVLTRFECLMATMENNDFSGTGVGNLQQELAGLLDTILNTSHMHDVTLWNTAQLASLHARLVPIMQRHNINNSPPVMLYAVGVCLDAGLGTTLPPVARWRLLGFANLLFQDYSPPQNASEQAAAFLKSVEEILRWGVCTLRQDGLHVREIGQVRRTLVAMLRAMQPCIPRDTQPQYAATMEAEISNIERVEITSVPDAVDRALSRCQSAGM
jgi:hypothetical protein